MKDIYVNIDWFTDCWMEVNGNIEWDMLDEAKMVNDTM